MDLLPKSHKEFSEKDYWDKFFKTRGTNTFEWYGEYLQLCAHLHKYMRKNDCILIPGCGSSNLSVDLYEVGFHNVTSIDISEVVIKQMKAAHSKKTDLKYICMDALNMTFTDEEFNVVLDKGTLDALMPDNTETTNETIDKYFAEIKRVLKHGGRYVCISLLQSHILKKLLASFCDKSWMFRVVRCHEAEQKTAEDGDGTAIPVFVVVASKFKQLPQLILEICMAGDKMQRVTSPEELQRIVKSAQDTAFITNGLAKSDLYDEEEVSLDLYKPDEETPRYTLYIIDHKKRTPALNKYAVFIVPQGRESEWLFGTAAGRRQLQDSARFRRLVVAVLRRGHAFASLDAVKSELEHSAKMLAPKSFTGMIPFLSVGADVGAREAVHAGESALSGRYAIEDVDVEGACYRRLVFLDNQFLVQSEARLAARADRASGEEPRVDFGHISLYHSYMCAGAQLAFAPGAPAAPGAAPRAAVLGLGGGGLCMFLRRCHPRLRLTAVELDPAMLDVAKNYFGLTLDHHLRVQIKDGIDFLKEEAEADSRYHVVMYDMDSKDRGVGLSCPPRPFLEPAALGHAKTILGGDDFYSLNDQRLSTWLSPLVCRDPALRDSITATLRAHFAHLATVKVFDEVNEIVFATNGGAYSARRLEAAGAQLNAAAKKALARPVCVDTDDLLQTLNIVA